MRRIKLTLQYDGTAYSGWQIQPSGVTIQGLLTDCIGRLTGEKSDVIGAGRTDSGVHAIEQVASFDSSSILSVKVMKRGLNALLPCDVRITDAEETDLSFHPRYSAQRKRYSYIIANTEDIPVFIQRYVWQITFPLDLEAMKTASAFLSGSHDFSSFRGSGCGARNPVRTVYSIGIERFSEINFLFMSFRGNFLRLSVEANGFLRHMARNIAGTIADVGKNKIEPEKVKEILEVKDRRLAGPTAPPNGLFLEKVIYAL